MSGISVDKDLIEVMEELEGDVDLSEWTANGSEGGEKRHGKARQGNASHPSKLSSDKKVEKNSEVSSDSKNVKKTTNDSSGNVSQNGSSEPQSKPEKKLATKTPTGDSANTTEQTKKSSLGRASSDVGDLAGVIGSLDSSRRTSMNAHKEDKKTRSDAKTAVKPVNPPSAVTARKRVSSFKDVETSKVRKIDESCKRDEVSQNVEHKDENTISAQAAEKDAKKAPICSEEDCKNIDTELIEEMIDEVKKDLMPKYGDKYIVRFSPVELADLADTTVQGLVTSQPNLAFYFRRQGKFKKKKGYAEVYLSQVQDARVFIQKLLQIKLVEHRIEVKVTVLRGSKSDEAVSLIIWLNKNGKVLELIKTTEDPARIPLNATKEKLQIEKVPQSVNTLLLRALFPFAAEVNFPTGQGKAESGYRGPVNLYYIDATWMEAVLNCCSDFTYNGCSLSVQYTSKKQETKLKPAGEGKKDAAAVLERRSSVQDKVKQSGPSKDDGTKVGKDNSSSAGSHKSESVPSLSTPQDTSIDDDISNMTLDVCTGMIESLNKLRQLGTDNPGILKILQMQNELAALQKSLSDSKAQTHNKTVGEQTDPWTVSATEDVGDKQQEQTDIEKEQEKLHSKEPKKKQNKETRAEKQRKEMEDLQKMIEEEDEAKRQREERAKRQIEIEKQKVKELEERRKASWARKMIDDAKQSGTQIVGKNVLAKEEIQHLLKMMEVRHKDAENAKKAEEEAKEKNQDWPKVTTGDENPHSQEGSFQAGSVKTETETRLDLGQAKQDSPADQDDLGEDFKSETEMDDQALDSRSDPWSPNRTLFNGAPVYTEQEYNIICSRNAVGTLPLQHYIQVEYYTNRRCPVGLCQSDKFFKTAAAFDVHWDVFHKAQVTVKFCQKCSAYFMSAVELKTHLTTRHSISNPQTVKKMVEEAREKTVSNPSYRDPGVFLPPVV